jgi:hemerythrin-like domain-containing protein
MHPTEILSREHRVIEKMLDETDEQIRRTEAGHPFPRRFFDEALHFFRNFADGCHHAKEENLLFPRMKERGVPERGGPIGVMLHEHDQGRAFLKGVRENLDAAEQGSEESRRLVFENARGYIVLLRQHIFKEDNILFRMAQMVLQPDDVADLNREFDAVEVPEKWRELDAVSGPHAG